jgi:hypothetical protein
MAVISNTLVHRHLTDDGLAGDGTNWDMNVDGSITPVPFYAGPTTQMWAIARMIVLIEDNGTVTAANYGAIAGGLTNGLTVQVREGGPTGAVLHDLLDGDNIDSNMAWAEHSYDAEPATFGSGNNFFKVRWTFSRAGMPLILDSFRTEKLVVTVRDDLTPLVSHQIGIQGIIIEHPQHLVSMQGVST